MIRQNNNTLAITGALTFDTVTALRDSGLAKMRIIEQPTMDFSEVEQCDSSALALLLAWHRAAIKDQKTLIFQNVPQQLLAVADVCGIKSLLFDNIAIQNKS